VPEEEERVNSGGELTDISGADEVLVTGDFGVRRGLTKSRNKEL
jgi:hypothetical protein